MSMCLCSHAEQPAEGLTTMAMCVCVADVPLDIDVTHVLPGDTRLIKGNVGRVPHDDPQEVSEKLPKSYPTVTQKLPKRENTCISRRDAIFPWFSNSTKSTVCVLVLQCPYYLSTRSSFSI